jgi:DNA polymerase type B, organellar and viral
LLSYPVGQFSTTLCHASLSYALQHEHIQKVWTYAVYQAKPLFASFVNYFWQKRQEAQKVCNTLHDFFFKRLMNSLAGKFGQRSQAKIIKPCKDKDAFDSTLVSVDEIPMQRWRFAGKEIWFLPKQCPERLCCMEQPCQGNRCLLRDNAESFDSFPGLAAAVTDYARMYLWELIQAAGPGTVYYCDTDCLIVSEAGYEALTDDMGSALGQLKLEQEADELTVWAPKDYQLGLAEVHKGIRLEAIPQAEEGAYSQEQWEHLRSGLRAGSAEGVRVQKTYKRLHRQLKTREPGPDGWTQALRVRSSR